MSASHQFADGVENFKHLLPRGDDARGIISRSGSSLDRLGNPAASARRELPVHEDGPRQRRGLKRGQSWNCEAGESEHNTDAIVKGCIGLDRC